MLLYMLFLPTCLTDNFVEIILFNFTETILHVHPFNEFPTCLLLAFEKSQIKIQILLEHWHMERPLI